MSVSPQIPAASGAKFNNTRKNPTVQCNIKFSAAQNVPETVDLKLKVNTQR